MISRRLGPCGLGLEYAKRAETLAEDVLNKVETERHVEDRVVMVDRARFHRDRARLNAMHLEIMRENINA